MGTDIKIEQTENGWLLSWIDPDGETLHEDFELFSQLSSYVEGNLL